MKIIYVTYENVLRTPILQAQVISPTKKMHELYDVDFDIISAIKKDEFDEIYKQNKVNANLPLGINLYEFSKTLPHGQSLFNFVKDIIPMFRKTLKLAQKSDIIHCRSYGGAFIGYIVHILSGKPFIFDMRGVLPEETVYVGKITENSFKFKLLKYIERVLVKKSAYVFTVSDKFSEYISQEYEKKNILNISNPTEYDAFKIEKTNEVIKFVYSGSLMPWHCGELAIQYFQKIVERFGNKVHLYFCTNMLEESKELITKYEIPKSSITVQRLPFNEMRKLNSSSHFAFCFTEPSFITSVCCPVKFAEYIASNQFVITNEGVGDLSSIVDEYKYGVSFKDYNKIDENLSVIFEQVEKILNGEKSEDYRKNVPFMNWNVMCRKIVDVYKEII